MAFPKVSQDLRGLSSSELFFECLYQLNVDFNLFLRGRESSLYIGAVAICLNLSLFLPLLCLTEDFLYNSGMEKSFCGFLSFFFGRHGKEFL